MMMYRFSPVILFFLQSCFLFNKVTPGPAQVLPEFIEEPEHYSIQTKKILEASGIAPSRTEEGKYWVHQDSGTPAEIHQISDQGNYIGKVSISNAKNIDWEDIASGPGPISGQNYLYISDTGDNLEEKGAYTIYRLVEPQNIDSSVDAESISFVYDDGESYDAETLLLDPTTLDLFIITKRQLSVRLFQLKYPYSTTETNNATFLGHVGLPFIVGGDISADGKEILIKSLDTVFYWQRKKDESISTALQRRRDLAAPYKKETQGEGICFSNAMDSYLTISEEPYTATSSNLYRYFKK